MKTSGFTKNSFAPIRFLFSLPRSSVPLLPSIVFLLLVLANSSVAWAAKVIIRTAKPYSSLVLAIEQRGGKVTHQYRYVNAIAAEIPDAAMQSIRAVLPSGAVAKDLMVELPNVALDRRTGSRLAAEDEAMEVATLDTGELSALGSASPDAYLINNTLMNLGAVHGGGFLGQGMKVAVIDTGIRPGFPHIGLDGSVIGGEDFVGDGKGYSNPANNGHGTFVAGMISANVVFNFATSSSLLNAVKTYCSSCVTNTTRIPMVGSAPLSSIYALRIFAPTGGAPTSRIIAAMERVLELRENFDNGMAETLKPDGRYDALNIKVCNMSLGGTTTFAGRDLEDELTNAFLQRDIVLVTSAGNAGPSGTTGGSPATGFGSLAVGASSSPVHERILRQLQLSSDLGPLRGQLFRPFGGIQTAYFSSRGPTADGRVNPDIVANGFASFGQGLSGGATSINIASGTSFSGPSVAGVAAVLRQAVPTATARQLRNALVMSANPNLIQDGSGPEDRGAGYVDAASALQWLQSGAAPDTPGLAGGMNPNVKVNINQGVGIQSQTGNVTQTVQGLLPGQRYEIYYRVTPNTSAVIVTLSGVVPGNPQNVLFGDDVILTVHSAKTSAIGEGDYKVFEFTQGGIFVVSNPETGLMRVTLNGDWTNASPIVATVNIVSLKDPIPHFTAQSKLADGGMKAIPFSVPAGAKKLNVRLSWRTDWGSYPTNDIDMYLVDPDGDTNLEGAMLNNPEQVDISNPKTGAWMAIVDGFAINTGDDKFELRIELDGKVLK